MTRGYFCTVAGNQLLKVAYLQSDAYLSYYGREILEAVISNTLDAWMDKQIAYNRRMYGKEDPTVGFNVNWIRRPKGYKTNGDRDKYNFAEYGYLFNADTGVLDVFHYGESMFTVIPAERDKYLYLFANDNNIWDAIHYDPEKLDYDYTRPDKKLIREATMDRLVEWNKQGSGPVLVLDDNHLIDVWHSERAPSYIKRLSYNNSDICPVNFYVSYEELFTPRNQCWTVFVQFPWLRGRVFEKGFPSEKAAVKHLRSFIIDNKEKVINFMRLNERIARISSAKDIKAAKALLKELEYEFKKTPWETFQRGYDVQSIRSQLNFYISSWSEAS